MTRNPILAAIFTVIFAVVPALSGQVALAQTPPETAPPTDPAPPPIVPATAPAAAPESVPAPIPAAPTAPQVIYVVPRPLPALPQAPPEPPPRPVVEGFYLGGSLVATDPFGGTTVTVTVDTVAEEFDVAGGFGVLVNLGYTIVPNFAVQLFGHYNAVRAAVPDSVEDEIDENDGEFGLFGAEARGVLESGRLRGWASVGVGSGGGTLKIEPDGASSATEYELDFGVVPVAGFGAEIRVSNAVRIGPHVRWYWTTVSRACVVIPEEDPPYYYYGYGEGYGGGGGGGGGGGTGPTRQCDDADAEVAPDILSVGLSLTYYVF